MTRGAQWDNYAQELIGLIVAQREIELLLANAGEHRTAMFFLDEFRDWFDISGEIADILAVDLRACADTENHGYTSWSWKQNAWVKEGCMGA